MVYNFFDKKSLGGAIKNEIMSNKELAKEIHKPVNRKLKTGKVHSFFVDNIWSTDPADMQLVSKFSKGFRFSLCVIGIYSKYAWVIVFKLVSTNFYQIFNFSPNNSPSKTAKKNFFSLSKKLFSFSRYLIFCYFSSFFPHFPDSKGQMEVD